jgi:hypothetical protein
MAKQNIEKSVKNFTISLDVNNILSATYIQFNNLVCVYQRNNEPLIQK